MKHLLTLAALALLATGTPAGAQNVAPPHRPVVAKSPAPGAQSPADAYWYDGTTRRELRIERARVADFADARGGAPRGRPVLRAPAPDDTTRPGAKLSPVFTAAGGPRTAPRALPGGIVVTLHAPGTAEQANQALAPFGLRVARPVDASGLRWVVPTEAGVAALEKANRLHESGAVAAAAPDWWVDVAKK